MKPETQFRIKVVVFLRSLDGIWFESIQQQTIVGTPDIIGCMVGRFFAIEVKSLQGKLSNLQRHKLDKIKAARGLIYIVSPENMEDFKVDFLAEYFKLRKLFQ